MVSVSKNDNFSDVFVVIFFFQCCCLVLFSFCFAHFYSLILFVKFHSLGSKRFDGHGIKEHIYLQNTRPNRSIILINKQLDVGLTVSVHWYTVFMAIIHTEH